MIAIGGRGAVGGSSTTNGGLAKVDGWIQAGGADGSSKPWRALRWIPVIMKITHGDRRKDWPLVNLVVNNGRRPLDMLTSSRG